MCAGSSAFRGRPATCHRSRSASRGRRSQAHLRERIDQRQLAGFPARADIPRATARLHRVVHRGAALALDHVALGVGYSKDQQLLVIIGQRCVDSIEPLLAEPRAVFQDVAADQLKADFVVALALGVELGVAAIGAILGEQPIERPDRRDRGRRRGLGVAGSPGIERRQ